VFANYRRLVWRFSIQSDQQPRRLRHVQARRRRLYAGVSAWLAALTLFALLYLSAAAAVELSSYNVFVLPTGVVLEWQTASEYDLIGFEVWYKEESASQSAYTLLGKRIAQGGPRRGVAYRMDVTTFLKADTVYCFQLRELPVSGDRGEILIRCGYGLGISAQPTPTPTPIFTPTSPFTLTAPLTGTQPVTDPFAVPTIDPFATPTPTIDPFATPTPTIDPFATPTIDPFATPTPTIDPFATPTPTTDPLAIPVVPNDANQGGVVFPTFTPTPFGQSVLPTPTPPFFTTPVTTTAGLFDSAAVTQPAPLTDGAAGGQVALTAPLTTTNPVQLAANPGYIVLTATPTSPAATPAPTFTAFPTVARMVEGDRLLGITVPDTQNLMIMLLCGVFSGASGLGILGLVSTLLYMRSRHNAQQSRGNQRHF
jgi:hypothetical protein